MKSKYEIYIFDLDGTLLDTLTDLCNACNYALRTCGMKERTREEVRRFVGNGVRKLMERAVPEGTGPEQAEEALAFFREYYMEYSLDNTSPYPGIVEMLAGLHNQGVRIAVVSNKLHVATQQLCEKFFNGLIDTGAGRQGYKEKARPRHGEGGSAASSR